jgi:putative phosphoribosyl transferase
MGVTETKVQIATETVRLDGVLSIPTGAGGLVLFAHGSGSSRLSPRNNYVAHCLREAGIGTLLFDLLTEREAADRAKVFAVDFLAQRLGCATTWVREQHATPHLLIGYFGASTGAAAALIAAAGDRTVRAIVSRGGRPDLAARALPHVEAPTLLIVGGDDVPVIRMNREAYEQLRCEKEMCIVPGASHLFEEPGTLEQVTRLATDWFLRHFVETGDDRQRAAVRRN